MTTAAAAAPVVEAPPLAGASPIVKAADPGDASISKTMGPESIVWTKAKVELIRRTKASACTDDEFEVFIEQCRRTGMDPLLDQADCVPRWSKRLVLNKETGVVEEKQLNVQTFQPREAGMRARADRFDDYRGISFACVREGDPFKITPSSELVFHEYNPADPKRSKLPIVGAWAQLRRAGRVCPVIWIPIGERIGLTRDGKPTQFWSMKAETMICKCARAEGYRIEYPNTFAGINIAEEMDEFREEVELNAPPAGATPTGSKTESTAAKVAAKAAEAPPKVKPSQQTVDVKVEKPQTAAADPGPKMGDAFLGPKFEWGPNKGKSIEHADEAAVLEAITLGVDKCAAEPDAAWGPTVAKGINVLRLDLERRMKIRQASNPTGKAREPGSDDGDEAPPVDPTKPNF